MSRLSEKKWNQNIFVHKIITIRNFRFTVRFFTFQGQIPVVIFRKLLIDDMIMKADEIDFNF